MKLSDTQMIRLGMVLIAAGVAVLFLPGAWPLLLAGFCLVGLGCAPVYPCIIHSQAVIGVQMASAYVGTCLMPPLFGIIANHITVALFPAYILALLILMAVMHELLTKKAPVKI